MQSGPNSSDPSRIRKDAKFSNDTSLQAPVRALTFVYRHIWLITTYCHNVWSLLLLKCGQIHAENGWILQSNWRILLLPTCFHLFGIFWRIHEVLPKYHKGYLPRDGCFERSRNMWVIFRAQTSIPPRNTVGTSKFPFNVDWDFAKLVEILDIRATLFPSHMVMLKKFAMQWVPWFKADMWYAILPYHELRWTPPWLFCYSDHSNQNNAVGATMCGTIVCFTIPAPQWQKTLDSQTHNNEEMSNISKFSTHLWWVVVFQHYNQGTGRSTRSWQRSVKLQCQSSSYPQAV